MANVNIQEGYKDAAWFSANPTLILLVGQKVNLEQTGTYKLGDGTTQLSALSFLGNSGNAVDSVNGYTGAVVLTKSDLSLGNVDNTSDANKPVSTAQATAIGLKEDSSNKSTSTSDFASSTKFPVWTAIVSFFDATKIKSILGITTLSGSNTGDETAARIGAIVNGTTDYTTPLDADKIGVWDVANSLFKAVTWANIKATLKAYFDTKYIMQLTHKHTTYSPLDSTTYYFNSNLLTGAPATANTNRFFTFPRAMTLKEANLMTIQTVNGSNESATIYLYNVTTGADVGAVGTFTNNAGASTVAAFSYTGLSLNVNNTDKYSWKIVTPPYVTNPTNVISEFRSYWITT